MSMSKKLYMNFGIILAMVVMLFFVTWYVVHREHDTKATAAMGMQVRSQWGCFHSSQVLTAAGNPTPPLPTYRFT